MLNFKVIGCGAAGNKAAANLVTMGYPAEKIFYVNSTSVDIPAEADESHRIIFGTSGGTLGGCGKERSIGKKMLLEDMRTDASALDNIVTASDNAVVLVGSTEGGSGSASIPILAKYFSEVFHKHVICVLFFGFKDDVRGLQNTIEICQELSENYGVVGIDNSSFLDECSGNRFKAEKAANHKFAEVLRILSGQTIINGEQVIDDTDLFKIVTTSGYMIADGKQLPDRMKSTADFDREINDMLLYSNFIDPPKQAGCKRIGTIFNLIDVDDTIDYSGKVIGQVYGSPYEYFIATGKNSKPKNEFYYIASGMKFPIDKIKAVYEEYKSRSESRDGSKDSFFAEISGLKGNPEDGQFDMLGHGISKPEVKAGKTDFFASFGVKDFKNDGKEVQTGAVDPGTMEEY